MLECENSFPPYSKLQNEIYTCSNIEKVRSANTISFMATLTRFTTKRSCTIVTCIQETWVHIILKGRKGRGKTSSVETLEGVWSLIIRDT